MRAESRWIFAAAVVALTVGAGTSSAAESATETVVAATEIDAVAKTPEDHLALETRYREKAKLLREDAATHQKMKADYVRRNTPASTKIPVNPAVKKMSAHCDAIVEKSEALAVEEEKFADFHAMRAKELQGK